MEMERQPSACVNGLNCEGYSSKGRGRCRGRARLLHEATHTSKPGHNNNSPDTARKIYRASHVQHDDRHLEERRPVDKVRNNRAVNKSHDRNNKENSSSPRPMRSHRAQFDSGMVSRINRHLLQGINERSDASAARLGLKKESSPPSNSPIRGSPDHAFGSPPNSTLGKQFESLQETVSAGLVYHSPATGQDEAKTAGAALGVVTSTPQHHTFHSQSPVSTTKVRGRGRARGRARSRQEGSDPAPSPGEVTIIHHAEPVSHSEDVDDDRYADAVDFSESATSSESVSDAVICIPEAVQSSSVSAEPAIHSGAENVQETLVASSDSGVVSSDGEEEHFEKRGRSPTGLTLDINIGKTDVDSQDLVSPDDITQLLSPNHVFVLDWAAAMETPEISDSPPTWYN